jgi:peptidoglycan L-alanyl-D-glutamate endopeptidase CwlK
MTNKDKIAQLLPLVGRQAQKLVDRCKKELGIDILITQAYRSIKEQDALYAQGRTNMKLPKVTNAKGGQSYHNFRVAFDVCPISGGKLLWNYDFKKIGKIGKELGFFWGGDWKNFKDMPHFEMTFGYTYSDFANGKVDLNKYK